MSLIRISILGIFWKAMPHRSFFLKGKVAHGVKEGKDRFTAILAVSMEGEKLKPMIIGKSAKPRLFPSSILPRNFYYESSSKAWITTAIFLKYLLILNIIFKSEDRSVAIILDNCSPHNVDSSLLSNIKLFFLPPNTTSIGQPMDAGVHATFARHFFIILLF
jgi:hypothetical protein